MKYTKRPLTIDEQINRLEQRGLNFTNREQAKCYLQNISYYRLRAFTYPFQNNTDPSADHKFLRNDIDFGDIVDLYIFDRRLRNLVFNELEKIEIAVRTQLSLIYSVQSHDPFWYYDTPAMPPSWMSLEVVTFGTLSRLYKTLDKTPLKRQIARSLQL